MRKGNTRLRKVGWVADSCTCVGHPRVWLWRRVGHTGEARVATRRFFKTAERCELGFEISPVAPTHVGYAWPTPVHVWATPNLSYLCALHVFPY
jgi:hypothetical protein